MGIEHRDTVALLDIVQSHAFYERRLARPAGADYVRAL
jgi:hypothetical protein